MWLDSESPGCLYDTIDCSDCRGCCESEKDKTPMDLWLEEKEPETCTTCNGSGEGPADGTTCWECKGKGEVLYEEE